MRLTHLITTTVLCLGLLAGCATAGSPGGPPVQISSSILTNPAGMTLYTFDKDPVGGGKSVCNGDCAVRWPPLMAGAYDQARGDYSIITRDDGSRQWAYKGKPLYLWFKDQKPGDTTGDGVNNVWHVAKP
ncbi:MAG: COG4315 family predicted lipoprotein [Thiobacillaceae bacterium]